MCVGIPARDRKAPVYLVRQPDGKTYHHIRVENYDIDNTYVIVCDGGDWTQFLKPPYRRSQPNVVAYEDAGMHSNADPRDLGESEPLQNLAKCLTAITGEVWCIGHSNGTQAQSCSDTYLHHPKCPLRHYNEDAEWAAFVFDLPGTGYCLLPRFFTEQVSSIFTVYSENDELPYQHVPEFMTMELLNKQLDKSHNPLNTQYWNQYTEY